MASLTFHIYTYGCQMNERDSDAIASLLAHHGYRPAAREASADVVIVNTCTVRERAERKAMGRLASLIAGKKRPTQWVGVAGCVAQRLGPAILDALPGLDFSIGTRSLHRLPSVLERLSAGQRPIIETHQEGGCEDSWTGHFQCGISAFVNILFGCNRACSYCVVPHVRGPEWSRPAAAIVQEVQSLAARGVREVTLLGQSVLSYGRSNPVWADAPPSPRGFVEAMPRLLEAVSGVPGIERIRFTAGHPSGCTAELACAMAELSPVCEHIHLPLQSGSDRILADMRRGYSCAEYREAVRRLRAAIPELAVTTDIIVGYPGETVHDFEQTRHVMDEIGFDNAFIFKYSPRPHTEAAQRPDDVSPAEKRRRHATLLADQERRSRALYQRCVGQTVDVLVEGTSPRNPRRWTGRTRANRIVVFEPTDGLRPGDRVAVRIERATAHTLGGVVIGRSD